MARVGGGCEVFFDTKTKSKWERKVKGQLSKSFQPALTSVSVEWQQFDENAPTPIQVMLLPNNVADKRVCLVFCPITSRLWPWGHPI